ncbi:MAG TPA: response regulator [Bryobacteraceae bacterium]|jgi:two-component system chemotaxis response regulator CheY
MKALVADDELTTRIVLQEILSGYGEVHSCVDGSEAVLTYRRALERGAPYDLVCMDILMPNMSGLEALKLIRREEESRGRFRPRATKVIITTASDDADTINQAFRELCDAYILKPIDAEELIGLVQCLFPIEECRL